MRKLCEKCSSVRTAFAYILEYLLKMLDSAINHREGRLKMTFWMSLFQLVTAKLY